MTIKIHGKEYKTVAERVNEIHDDLKEKSLSIETELVSWADSVVVFKATVTTPQGVFTGHAYEDEGKGANQLYKCLRELRDFCNRSGFIFCRLRWDRVRFCQ